MANNNNGVQVNIGASASGLQSALQQSVSSLQSAAQSMTSSFSQINQSSVNSANITQQSASKMSQAFNGVGTSLSGLSNQIKGSLSGVASSMGPAGSAISSLTSSMSLGLAGVAAAAVAAGAALAGMVIEGSVDKLKQHVKESKNLALAFDTTSSRAAAMADVFEDSGVNAEDLLNVSQSLTRSLTKNQETFEKYGISIKDSNGAFLSQEAIIGNIIDKYKTMATNVDKQVFLQQTLRGVSQDTIEKMAKAYGDDLPAAISKSEESLKKLGAIASDQDIADVSKYNQAIRDMADIMDGASQSFASGILPALIQMKEGFNQAFGDGSLATLARNFGQIVGDVFIILSDIINTFLSFLSSSFETISSLFGEYASTTETSTKDTLSSWDYMIIGIQSAIGILSIGLQTLVSFFKIAFVSIVEVVKSAAHTVFSIIEGIVGGTLKLAKGDLSGAANAVTSAYQKVSQSWQNTGKTISSTFDNEMNKIGKSVEDRADKLANSISKKLQNANAGSPTFTKKPGSDFGSNKALNLKDSQGSSQKIDDTTKAEYTLIKAKMEAELMILRDGLSRQQEVLDSKLKDQIVSYKEYFDEKAKLQKEDIQKSIEIKQREINENEKLQSKATKDSERIKLQADAVKLQADIVILKNKEQDIDRRSIELLRDKQKEMSKMITDMRAQLADATNSIDPTAKFAQIEMKYKDTLERMKIEGDKAGIAIVEGLINVEKAKVRIDSLEKEYQIFNAKISQQQSAITEKEKRAELTSEQVKKQRRELEKKSIQEQIALKQKQMEISQQSGDLVKVEELKAQIAELNASKEDINEFGQGVNKVFESAFEGFFTDVISGTKSVSEAFKDMGKQILAQIAQIVAKWLAAKVMGAFNPGAASSIGADGTGGGMGDMLGSLAGAVFGGFKESGGYTMSGNAYVVGEKGPEIFMPQTAGSIIPNHSLGGGGQGNTNIYVDATDANSFRRSSGQIATSYANAMNRNLKRNG